MMKHYWGCEKSAHESICNTNFGSTEQKVWSSVKSKDLLHIIIIPLLCFEVLQQCAMFSLWVAHYSEATGLYRVLPSVVCSVVQCVMGLKKRPSSYVMYSVTGYNFQCTLQCLVMFQNFKEQIETIWHCLNHVQR